MMENNDTLDEQTSTNTQQPDNLTTEDALNVNGGESVVTSETESSDGFVPEINRVGSELAELKDKYLRLYADFENFRRRTAKEKLDLIGTANEGLLQALIPVVDDFERARQAMENTDDAEALNEGVSLIYTKLVKTLESKGLKPMESAGQPFDAELHDSIAQFPAPSDDMKGKVIDEIEKGYYLNDKVIRFAKVIVGS